MEYSIEFIEPKPDEKYISCDEHIRVLALIAYYALRGEPLNSETLRSKVIEINKNLPGEESLRKRAGYVSPKRAVDEAELFVEYGRIQKKKGFYILRPDDQPAPEGIYRVLERCGWIHLHRKHHKE